MTTTSPTDAARDERAQVPFPALTDIAVMTRRNLIVWRRMPAFIAVTLVQPVLFVLLFRFVFGGAIEVGSSGYVDYLVPGILVQTVAFTSSTTAIALARALARGAIDRFRSMPISRAAFLGGRLAADGVRTFLTILVILAVGFLLGFRMHNGVVAGVGMVLLALVFGVAMSVVSAYIGLAIKSEEAVQGIGLIWVFPLTFVSSIFVPTASMPGWLRGFAEYQPMSIVADTMRHLALGGPGPFPIFQAIGWVALILVVFFSLSVRAYNRL